MRNVMVCLASIAALVAGVAGVAVTAGTAISQVTPMPVGNVLLAVGNGKVEEHTPTGALVQTLDSTTASAETTGMCFDSAGNLYSTNFQYGSVAKFDPSGTLINKDFVSPAQTNGGHPESCVFDSSGNFYVGLPDLSPTSIQKYSPTGTLLNTYQVTKEDRGSDWLDLASDQCTLYYTSEGSSVLRYNACTSTQLAPFATGLPGPCFAHRLLADGSVLVACAQDIVHLSSSGTVISTFSATSLGSTGSELFAMNIDPDGSTFWTSDLSTGKVIRANISTGAVVGGFTPTATGGSYGGLSVVGEVTVGQPTTTTTTTTAMPTTTKAAPTTAAKPAPATTAPAAQPVSAKPTFTG